MLREQQSLIRTTVVGSQPLGETVYRRRSSDSFVLLHGNGSVDVESVVEQSIRLQESWNIDILSEGELFRHEKKGDDYIVYFALGLFGARRVKSDIGLGGVDLYTAIQSERGFIVDDWVRSQKYTQKPVKINIPGPLTFARRMTSSYYKDILSISRDASDSIRCEVSRLIEAGCKWIQIDDPHLVWDFDLAQEFGFEHLNRAISIETDANIIVHLCRGNGYSYIGSTRTFDSGPYYDRVAKFLAKTRVTGVSVEAPLVSTSFKLKDFGDKDVVLGVSDIHVQDVESVQYISNTVERALDEVDPRRLILSPNCGMRHMDVATATAKVRNIVQSAANTRSQLDASRLTGVRGAHTNVRAVTIEQRDRMATWFLLLNTEKAGSAWVGQMLAKYFGVTMRHNKISLVESVWGSPVEKEFFLPGKREILSNSEDYSIVDHFLHLEANLPYKKIYGMADAFNSFRYCVNRIRFRDQADALHQRSFKVANLIMHPIKVVDSVFRMWKHHSVYMEDNNWKRDYDIELVSGLLEMFQDPSEEDELFVCCSVYVLNAITRDIELCKAVAIPCVPFEWLRDRPSYLSQFVSSFVRPLTKGEQAVLSEICSPANRNLTRSIVGYQTLDEEINSIMESMGGRRRAVLRTLFAIFNVGGVYGRAYELSGLFGCKRALEPYPIGEVRHNFRRNLDGLFDFPLREVRSALQ